ncbi:hypothetical protein [Sphingomonas sp.]|uniref:hypothetical protein n=1 Tax=Sphingomonas sp. TaxID=28214 RepID=UPI002EDAA17E
MPLRRMSIAVPIFLLAILSVTLAVLVMFAVTFRGRPPQGAPVPLAVIARGVEGQPLPQTGRPLECASSRTNLFRRRKTARSRPVAPRSPRRYAPIRAKSGYVPSMRNPCAGRFEGTLSPRGACHKAGASSG